MRDSCQFYVRRRHLCRRLRSSMVMTMRFSTIDEERERAYKKNTIINNNNNSKLTNSEKSRDDEEKETQKPSQESS